MTPLSVVEGDSRFEREPFICIKAVLDGSTDNYRVRSFTSVNFVPSAQGNDSGGICKARNCNHSLCQAKASQNIEQIQSLKMDSSSPRTDDTVTKVRLAEKICDSKSIQLMKMEHGSIRNDVTVTEVKLVGQICDSEPIQRERMEHSSPRNDGTMNKVILAEKICDREFIQLKETKHNFLRNDTTVTEVRLAEKICDSEPIQHVEMEHNSSRNDVTVTEVKLAEKICDSELIQLSKFEHSFPRNDDTVTKVKLAKKICDSNVDCKVDDIGFNCDNCNRTYNHKSSLVKHNKLKHNITIEKSFKCSDCSSQFNSVYNLNAHRKKKHPKGTDESDQDEVEFESQSGAKVTVKTNKKKVFLCKLCGKKFSHLSGLSYHKKKKHGSTIDRPFKCANCDAKYAMKRSLQSHLRKEHSSIVSSKPRKFNRPSIMCVLCSLTVSTSMLLSKHYADNHQINIESLNLEFSSFDQFLNWKQNFEKETNEKFILERGCQISKAKTKKHRYLCHRSGYFVRRGGGFRRLKNQGSKKMNAHCPAMMAVTEFEDGACKVYAVKTHVGHSADLCHISLTPAERSHIADQIASKVPFDDILDKIRSSVPGSPSERLHLLKRKDLHNIEKEFNLSGDAEKHQNDAVSIHTWISSVSNQVDSCILFYKARGQESDVSDNFLNVDDFVLILMDSAQSEVLLKYCQDKIIVDGTFISQTDISLVTLLVMDDLHHSFPAAFLVSSRIDEEILFLFYHQIKLKVGTVTTNVFMSDVEESFYTAWLKVMEHPPCHLLWSSWHVDSSWRKSIKQKVNDTNQRAEIYKILRVLYQEKNIDSFTKTLNNFMENVVQNITLEEFRSYFSKFVACPSQWASCFRTKCGIGNDSNIEQMHRTLRHIFVKGRRLRDLDKVMIALMKLVLDKLYHRDLILQRGNVNAKNSIINNRHVKSTFHLPDAVTECSKGWQVPSSSENFSETCLVSKNHKKQFCSCKSVCPDCQACIHLYTCECIDSSILGNMCEHVHLVCRYLQQSQTLESVVPAPSVSAQSIMAPSVNAQSIAALSIDTQSLPSAIDTPRNANDAVSDLMEVDAYQIYVMPDAQSHIDISAAVPDLMQRKENVINLFLEAVNSVTNFEEMAIIERSTSNLLNLLASADRFSQVN